MSADRAPRLIALDWGTTSLRAYLLGEDGVVLDRRAEPAGILQVPGRDFAGAFRTVVGDWRASSPGLPLLASGMIGSAQGWVEAPYVDVPADVDAVARSLVTVPGTGLRIVPGLAQRGADPDVMRGEETQLFGGMLASPALAAGGTVVLPGTHSKWVRTVGGRIERFTTYMTGEVYAVLRGHSILGRLADRAERVTDEPGPAFRRGVRAARRSTAGLASVLFSARSAVLVGDLPAAESLEYLSGLLIGDEIRSALSSGDAPTALIGEGSLCARYAFALAEFDVSDIEILGDTAPAGLWLIARRAGLALQRGEGPSRRPVSGRFL
ncbi:MAG TPA: 2-dehydro-3-deoxygalactonokinase [Gemmatimonadaceae bacterium]|nr:2-dehydro-3-deoxygalactonokinase [Gemmatimonadaceae bacterium]